MNKENPYHIEIIGQAIGHFEVIEIPYSPVLNLDLSMGNMFGITLTGDMILNIDKMLGGRFLFFIRQDSLGAHSLSFGSLFKFAEIDAGLISSDQGAISIVDFVTDPETEEIFTMISSNYVN